MNQEFYKLKKLESTVSYFIYIFNETNNSNWRNVYASFIVHKYPILLLPQYSCTHRMCGAYYSRQGFFLFDFAFWKTLCEAKFVESLSE